MNKIYKHKLTNSLLELVKLYGNKVGSFYLLDKDQKTFETNISNFSSQKMRAKAICLMENVELIK